jgi:hypothetical protein
MLGMSVADIHKYIRKASTDSEMEISLEEYITKNNKTSSWSKIYPIIL